MKRVMVGVTGASGAVYAERLIQVLLGRVERVYLTLTDSAAQVVRHELKTCEGGFSLVRVAAEGRVDDADRAALRIFRNDDLFAPIASGSSAPDAMVIVPCSMGTLARITHGISGNLLERAADVCLKQKRPLIVVPRETPLSIIHLRNMLALAEAGATIVPAMPGFYHHPKEVSDIVDFQVGRLLECLGLEHDLYPAWNSRMR